MSDPNAAWMPDWQSMQKQFFSAWTDAARGAGKSSNPVQEGFDAWMKLIAPRDSGNEVLDKVVGGARQFAEFMQGVIGQLASSKPDMVTPAGIRAALEQAFGGLAPAQNPVLDALRGISSEGARGFEDLYREWMKMAKPIEADARSWMDLPAFGYARESQERQQALARAVADYQDQNTRYQVLMYKASRLGLDKFESKLAERSEPGREITSLRGLYDVFVDAAEEGYAEVALSDEFREVYGALVNAQMRVRQAIQTQVEQTTGALGMPVRSELDTVHQRLHEMRRRIAELEERLNQANVDAASVATPIPVEAEPVAEAPAKRAPKPRASAKPKAAAKRVAAPASKTSTRNRS
ncbi:MAG: class III poly(R)-hydroxyalkanoic acid synthase subunit PhaE [Lysobacterales bacterium]